MVDKYDEKPTPTSTKSLLMLISFVVMCVCALLFREPGRVYSRIAEVAC